ncbi:hypothetical protein QW180_29265 [Vibrio sinaloensis]|nr:hypothetical protein [Vibrio sinaloensis]
MWHIDFYLKHLLLIEIYWGEFVEPIGQIQTVFLQRFERLLPDIIEANLSSGRVTLIDPR